MPVRDVLIIGAGPSGLATAIAAKRQGLDFVIVEKGVLVNSIFNFPMHMVFFTTPELLEIGYYDLPNYLGVPGEDLPHVSHYYTDAHPYYRQRVVVVGGKNSAAEASLELFRGGAHVTLVHRHPALGDSIKYWVKPDIENRIKEGSIAARFNARVVEITPTAVHIEHNGVPEQLPAEAVYLLTGY